MKILLADDDSAVRRVLQFKLKKKGFDVTVVEDGEQALDSLKLKSFDLLLADIRMPKVDGIELLERIKQIQPNLKTILITAHASVPQAVEAVKLGAFDYITKPFEDEELFVAIDKALEFKRLEIENKKLKGKLRQQDKIKNFVGISKPFRDMMNIIDKIAATDATILLSGDSGTGKEMVAKSIHYKSMRAENEFIAVNCAAIPKDLIESELFGHVKGAFTGAVRDKKGKFELADGGTLLLDEISELSFELQAKLLRVLQERIVEPVGGENKKEIDVRIIAATNVSLKERVSSGKFREDLFYRLNVIPIHIPSLKERKNDIPILINEFLIKFGKGKEITVTPKLLETLMNYSWPGNVRELENLIERMIILRKSEKLTENDIPDDFNNNVSKSEDIDVPNHLTYYEAEKKIITEALDKFAWNRSRAALYLKIPRHMLIYRMKKYNIFNR
ncbi:MAG: sigma-54-dependent transcriptional regulator [Candidatus Zixiibacteriota bacterium]